MSIVPIDEIFQDILELHNYNIEAIAIRMSKKIKQMRLSGLSFTKRSMSFSNIKAEVSLNNAKALEKYRSVLLSILDEPKSETDRYIELSKINIVGMSCELDVIYRILSESDINGLITSVEISGLKTEVIDIIDTCQKVIRLLEDKKEWIKSN